MTAIEWSLPGMIVTECEVYTPKDELAFYIESTKGHHTNFQEI